MPDGAQRRGRRGWVADVGVGERLDWAFKEARNAFIHRGEQPSVEAARKSIVACERLMERLMSVVEEYTDIRAEDERRRQERQLAEIRRTALEQLAASATAENAGRAGDPHAGKDERPSAP
jgi:hypothetical protein